MKTRFPLPVTLATAITVHTAPIQADTVHGNFSPLMQSLGLRIADAPDNAQWQFAGELSLTNEYQRVASGNELLLLDYEQTRLDISLQRRLNADWSISLNAGVFYQGGGFGDSFIDDWHRLFSLPENGRDLAARNQFAIRYQRNGQTVIDLEPGSGLSYASLAARQALSADSALHWTLSLPDSNRHQISAGSKPALSLAYSKHWQTAAAGQFNAQAGITYRDSAGPLAALQRDWLLSGSLAWRYPLLSQLDLLLQLDVNSAAYRDTGLETLEAAAGVISVAVATKRWQLGFREDLLLGKGSPDFGVFIKLKQGF